MVVNVLFFIFGGIANMKLLQKIKKIFFYRNNIRNPFFLKFLFNGNQFIGDIPKLKNTRICIKGSNNILFCEKNVVIENSTITFNADNSLIYLCSGKHRYDISIYNNSVFYVGKNNYFNPYGSKVKIVISEGKNILIGNNNIFSFNIFIRTADPHLIYDAMSHQRLNLSKSIYIGDHIWIGQDTTILKGAKIYSGSIIGTKSLVTNKIIPSNEAWGGCPAKILKRNIFWEGSCVHSWNEESTNKNMIYPLDTYIYDINESNIIYEEIENKLHSLLYANDKLLYLQNMRQDKNRFCKKSMESSQPVRVNNE